MLKFDRSTSTEHGSWYLEGSNQSRCDICPIALALQEAYDDPTMYSTMHFGGSEQDPDLGIDLPGDAVDFVARFDGGHSVDPFSFEVTEDNTWKRTATI